jgi:hypothetical protein
MTDLNNLKLVPPILQENLKVETTNGYTSRGHVLAKQHKRGNLVHENTLPRSQCRLTIVELMLVIKIIVIFMIRSYPKILHNVFFDMNVRLGTNGEKKNAGS